jgi:formate-nitrite transporter family protein
MLKDQIYETEFTEDDWLLGRSNAHVTTLEYGDFECPYTAMARPVLDSLVDEYPNAIQLVFLHFPISSTHRLAAAEAAESAGAQGMFWEMHDMLFAHQDQLTFENLRLFARLIRLEMERFDHDLMGHRYRAEVQQDVRHGIQDGVSDTLTLFINGRRYDGFRDRASILSAVAALMPG